ncbi:hypothetical protein FRB95_012409 [Tulasnella sp. JGI-2019a]|nr:hypothetical protein FRB95_012409 [Tulasnella sp. JGI-2019a]
MYISKIANGDASAPRVPKVYDYFTNELNEHYLVMEYIEANSTPAQNALEKLAKALQWLRDLPASPGVTIGPVGGGYIRHSAFKDHTAPLPLLSKDALERL